MRISLNPTLNNFALFFFFALIFAATGCGKKNGTSNQVLGQVTTLAGSGVQGAADGKGAAASFSSIWGITVDAAGNIYVTDTGLNQVRKITPQGEVTTLPDNGPGSTNALGVPMVYADPLGVAIDGSGNLFVSYLASGVIRKVPPTGKGVVFAGGASNYNSQDGLGTAASISQPIGLAVDGVGNVYVAGYSSMSIRKIYPNGLVTTLAGNSGYSGPNDGTGSAARFKLPGGVAVDASGNVYVADTGNHLIRKITPEGVVTTIAGSGSSGSADGAGAEATFNYPEGIAVDNTGNVYVADTNNNMIRKITPSGSVTTIAGNTTSGSENGVGTEAGFSSPTDIAINHEGTLLYVADRGNNLVRKIAIK